MQKIKWIDIEGRRIAVKKGLTGWRVVNPIKDEDGKINWKNLLIGGSWLKLVFIIITVIAVLFFLERYSDLLTLSDACLRALPDSTNLNLFIENTELKYETMFKF